MVMMMLLMSDVENDDDDDDDDAYEDDDGDVLMMTMVMISAHVFMWELTTGFGGLSNSLLYLCVDPKHCSLTKLRLY
eukprot:1149501-Karenia_brevis.AAC.1